MRHAGHEPAPGGSLAGCGSRSPWGPADGPGRMASRQGPRRARQPHAGAAARPSARIEPGREHLAVLARQRVVEPRVRLLPRHRRTLLLRVEPPHRPALDHHVHRPPGLGQCIQCMMISAGWYYLIGAGLLLSLTAPALVEEFYIVQNPTTKKCTIVTERPTTTTTTVVGGTTYTARTEAQNSLKPTEVCATTRSTTASPSRSLRRC